MTLCAARPARDRVDLRQGLWQHALWVGLTMAVVCLALLQLGHALAVRSERESLFSLGARSNPGLLGAVLGAVAVQLAILYLPFLQALFDTEPLGPVELVVVLVASTAAFLAVELEKLIIRRRARRSRHAPG